MSKLRTVHLECSECKNRNYKVKRGEAQARQLKLEVSKYCKFCKKHTVHKTVK